MDEVVVHKASACGMTEAAVSEYLRSLSISNLERFLEDLNEDTRRFAIAEWVNRRNLEIRRGTGPGPDDSSPVDPASVGDEGSLE